ncbi:MAG: hypothetical protein GXY76_23135 [Chloroflexi bacterium]|nr:hypothetical protein [Chloroflexota bacterium]
MTHQEAAPKPRRRARGGGRSSGRPIMYSDKMVAVSVTLPEEAIADLIKLGGRNLSAGIRVLWEAWREQQAKQGAA